MTRAPMHGEPAPCPYCGQPLVVVAVHGHGQCAACGINVAPCCSGADLDAEADLVGATAAGTVDPQLFVRLFAQLGSVSATVTHAALLHALARWLDGSLDDAAIVLEAGVALGHVEAGALGVRLPRLPPAEPPG